MSNPSLHQNITFKLLAFAASRFFFISSLLLPVPKPIRTVLNPLLLKYLRIFSPGGPSHNGAKGKKGLPLTNTVLLILSIFTSFSFFLCLISLVLQFFSVAQGPAVAGTLNLNGTWQYRNGDAEGQESFDEKYGIDFSHTVHLTEILDLNANIRYTRDVDEEETDEFITPTVDLSVVNDIFLFRLSGVASEQKRSLSPDSSGRSLQAMWRSVWEKRFWPG